MNFYEYYQPGETLDDNPVYLAAKDLIQNGFQVIPLKKGAKEPEATIKSVYTLIAKPISEHNIDFYFKERDVDIGIIMDHNTEFIDIDEKNKPGISVAVMKAIRSGWPDLFDKLFIDSTPSGGVHLIYRSEVTGGKPVLAKVHSKPNPKATIERISRATKQYIKISPSDGYVIKQHTPFEIPFLTAEERNFISAVCASFNEVITPEVKKKEAERQDSPWAVFNKSHDWKYISGELIERNWIVYKDDTEKIYVRRPGDTNQKYSGVIFKDTNTLYLFTPSSEFENEKPYSPFGVYSLFYHESDHAAACRLLSSQGCGVNIFLEGQFWYREKQKLKIKYTELLNWFHSIGYRRYKETIVQVINNIVDITDEKDMKRAFINEVEYEIRDDMFEKVGGMFSEDGGLMSMLNELEDNFITDTKDATWLFFNNLAIKITAEGYEPFTYNSINGFIWKSSIIQRDFYETDYTGCDADRFISILGGDRKKQLQEIIGYTISKYKDPLNPRAVIIMEDIEASEEGESQGGSGKGLCFQFIKQFRKSTDFDGKNFRPSDPFLYQNVDPDTAIIFIDDVEKNFRFTSLFSILTGPLAINRKNKPQIIIPYDQSPKIVITSNYFIGGIDISAKRRKYEFPVVKHFGETIEPIDEFGRQFFAGWDRGEWLKFDNFIAYCCRSYLAEGNKKSIGITTENSAERALINATSRDFVEYMDNQLSLNMFDFAPNFIKNKTIKHKDGSVTTNAVNKEMYDSNAENPDYYIQISKPLMLEKIQKITNYRNLTTTKMTRWLVQWSEARNVVLDQSYKRSSDGERMYRFISWPSHFDQNNSENESRNGWSPNPEW